MKAPVVSTFRTLDSMNEHAGRLSLFLPVESFHCYFIVISLSFCHCSWKLLLEIYSLQFQAEGAPCRPKGLLSDLKGQNAALQEIFWEDRSNT